MPRQPHLSAAIVPSLLVGVYLPWKQDASKNKAIKNKPLGVQNTGNNLHEEVQSPNGKTKVVSTTKKVQSPKTNI